MAETSGLIGGPRGRIHVDDVCSAGVLRARGLAGAVASLSLIATLCLVAASPAGAGPANFTGDATSGTISVHTNNSPEVFTNPTSHLNLNWDDPSPFAPLSGSLTMAPVRTAPFIGPFDLKFYVQAAITTTGPITGALDTAAGTFTLHTNTNMAVTVYNMTGATPNPNSDNKITGPGCKVAVSIDWTGTMTATSVHLTAPQFLIPTFPSGDDGCGAATNDLNARVAGQNNAADLTYAGTRSISNPAMLRVTTNPALPGDIIVDGIARDAWGLNWAQFPVGSHQVCFGDVLGYVKPGCQTVTLTAGTTTTVQGTYTRNGYLRVHHQPGPARRPSPSTGWPATTGACGPRSRPAPTTSASATWPATNAPACRDVTVVAGSHRDHHRRPSPPTPSAPGPAGHLRLPAGHHQPGLAGDDHRRRPVGATTGASTG